MSMDVAGDGIVGCSVVHFSSFGCKSGSLDGSRSGVGYTSIVGFVKEAPSGLAVGVTYRSITGPLECQNHP